MRTYKGTTQMKLLLWARVQILLRTQNPAGGKWQSGVLWWLKRKLSTLPQGYILNLSIFQQEHSVTESKSGD